MALQEPTYLKGVTKAGKGFVEKLSMVPARFEAELLNRVAKINPAPVFVLGNQKSGTSVIAALVAEAVGASVTIDIRGMYGEAVQTKLRTGEIPFSDFVSKNRLDFSREIVKEPNLTFFYHELAEYFPASKVIFVNRDPRSNIRSILNRLSIPGDLPHLGETQAEGVDPLWRPIFERDWFGLEGENYVEVLAARWNLATDTYLENAENIALIRYEDFCKDKVEEIAGLARRIGLEPVNDISGKVDHQYQPRGDKSISWSDFFGLGNLARIESICGDRMKKFGYITSEG